MVEPHWRSSPFFAFRWLIVPLAITNFSIGPCQLMLMRAIFSNFLGSTTWTEELYLRSWQYSLFVCGYLVVVQVIVLSLLLAWSEGRLWARLLVYWSCVLGIAGCVMGGLWFSTPLGHWLEGRQSSTSAFTHDTEFSTTNGWSGVAAIPLLLLTFQFPFWLIRGLLGWRLQRLPIVAEDQPVKAQRESLSISDLLTGTAIVAVCLGLLRLGAVQEKGGEGTSGREFLIELAVSAVVVALALYATAVPLAALFLRDFRRDVAWAAALLMAAFCTLVVYVVVWRGATSADPGQVLFDSGVGALTLVFAYCGGLSLLHRCGWRLVWRKPGFTGKSVG
jgi:hypothetical protein